MSWERAGLREREREWLPRDVGHGEKNACNTNTHIVKFRLTMHSCSTSWISRHEAQAAENTYRNSARAENAKYNDMQNPFDTVNLGAAGGSRGANAMFHIHFQLALRLANSSRRLHTAYQNETFTLLDLHANFRNKQRHIQSPMITYHALPTCENTIKSRREADRHFWRGVEPNTRPVPQVCACLFDAEWQALALRVIHWRRSTLDKLMNKLCAMKLNMTGFRATCRDAHVYAYICIRSETYTCMNVARYKTTCPFSYASVHWRFGIACTHFLIVNVHITYPHTSADSIINMS